MSTSSKIAFGLSDQAEFSNRLWRFYNCVKKTTYYRLPAYLESVLYRRAWDVPHPELFVASTDLFLQLEECPDEEGAEHFLQRTETWLWKDKVETMTVEFWERFRDQVEKATSYRSEYFQFWMEKCEGAPFHRYPLQVFLESFKKKVIFDDFVKVRQYSRDDVVNKHVAWLQMEVKRALKDGSGLKALVEEYPEAAEFC